jgi:hypothetical protein
MKLLATKLWPVVLYSLTIWHFSDAADPLLSYKAEIIAKAQPDEFFYSLFDAELEGSGDNIYKKSGFTPGSIEWDNHISAGGLPKINQSYVWGMTRKDDYLWWGTGPNVNRLVSGVYFGSTSGSITTSRGITFSATEYAGSKFAREGVVDLDGVVPDGPIVSPSLGDWRPPDAYRYNLNTDTQENLYDSMDSDEKSLLWKTLGLRSAGYSANNATHTKGLVFLAGPSITATTDGGDGVIMFAFDANTGDCVDAKSFPAYSNIRKWKFHDDQLYTAIATQTGTGEVLRWVNDPSDALYPFEFQVVGELDAGGAELEVHQGRLFVNTWPGIEGNLDIGGDITAVLDLINAPAGLWRSPTIPAGGLTSSNAGQWSKVWSITEYEPDLIIALHYGGGAMTSFDGYLYWGTMHVPFTSSIAHSIGYGNPTPPTAPTEPGVGATQQELDDYAIALADYELARGVYNDENSADFYNSYRAISIFRGKDFTSNSGDIELVYGNATMPVRLERAVFTETPRGELTTTLLLKWQIFFTDNIGKLRNVPDGFSTPTYFGFFSRTTLEDGGDWENVPNASGYTPLFGPEGIIPRNYGYGFTFPWNNYTWTMQVFNNKLYIGTMDWDGIDSPNSTHGADLFCIPSADQAAVRVSGRGMANWSSYGIRTIAADDSRGELYLGMANVQNMLHTEVGDPASGGWEIQRVTQRYLDEDLDELEDSWEISEFGSTEAKNNAAENNDNDPLNLYQEWLAGTNPDDGKGFFTSAIKAAETEGLQKIEWSSNGAAPTRYYTVYEATDLGGTWTPAATYEGTGSTISHQYDPADNPLKFFKIKVSLDAPAR